MPTNKPVLKTVEQFMSGYSPVYKPIYPLFLGKSQAYPVEAGKHNFNHIETLGDIRAKHITPKDTEIFQIGAKQASKTFKKYFLANQFQLSHLQGREGMDDVVAEVLDEHQKHMDDLFLLGEGTSDSTMVNNGLFWSDDSNYVLETSTEIDSTDRLLDFHSDIMATAIDANQIAGRKVLIVYGSSVLPLYNSLHSSGTRPFKSVLAEVLGPDYSLVQLPEACTPSNTNGWIVANLDQVKLHYTKLPGLQASGSNEEKQYYWFNFLMGSCMLECLTSGAIIRQPATLEG